MLVIFKELCKRNDRIQKIEDKQNDKLYLSSMNKKNYTMQKSGQTLQPYAKYIYICAVEKNKLFFIGLDLTPSAFVPSSTTCPQ